MFQRMKGVAYRSSTITPDTAERMRLLERRAVAQGGVRIMFTSDPPAPSWDVVAKEPGPTGLPPWQSLRPAGREVRLQVVLQDYKGPPETQRQAEIEMLWSLAVPLGFIPWTRYPLPGLGDDVFHVIGPWQALYDSLCGAGRGELAWPSVCCAAQVDIGRWEGDRRVERFVQAQIHRLGIPIGPIDGLIADPATEALRALGLGGLNLEQVANALLRMDPPSTPQEGRRLGHVIVPGNVNALAYGKVSASRNSQGYLLTIDGPGRVVLDVGEVG